MEICLVYWICLNFGAAIRLAKHAGGIASRTLLPILQTNALAKIALSEAASMARCVA
jgi:hypothetical protein